MPENTKKYPRLYIDATLSADALIDASQPHYHYLMNVLRLKPQNKVVLFNEKEGEWLAEINQPSKKQVQFKLIEFLRHPILCSELTLYFAPLKRVAMDFVIEKGTELGVTHFVPVLTDYTQKTFFNAEKYTQTAIEAAEQCERFDVPSLAEPVKLKEALANYSGMEKILWADEGTARHEIDTPSFAMTGSAILIGPEGGFSDTEQEILRADKNVVSCSLGPRILRAETAALVMLATVTMCHSLEGGNLAK